MSDTSRAEPPVAEVLAKNGELRLRLGFRDGEGIYAKTPLVGLEPGSFVAHDGDRPIEVDGAPLVVAAAGTALSEIHRIAARAQVRIGFDKRVASEAATLCRDPRTDESDLRDLRALPFVTIDYEHSRDLDQALYIEERDQYFDVYYALADAASYIALDSQLLAESIERGTSFYMPGLTAPMLPRVLSEGLISLNPKIDRRALVFRIVLDGAGNVEDFELFNAVIHSRAKLTYDGVQAFADDAGSSPIAKGEAARSIELLEVVGRMRASEARTRNVIRYDRVATRLELPSPGSGILEVRTDIRNDTQKWNEQISLLTNMVGATFLRSNTDAGTGVAGLFRVHPRPEETELEGFANSVAALVATLGLPKKWCWNRESETLADYIDRLPDDGEEVRLSAALQRQAMLMGRPSRFSTEAAPHFGVGAEAYSRFSSPMREVVGILTMHIALAQQAQRPLKAAGLTEALTAAAVAAGNRAGKLQKKLTRDCNKLAIDHLFSAELTLEPSARPERTATVLGVSETKVYLQLDDPPIEVKLYIPDQERMLGASLALTSRFELASPDKSIVLRVGDVARVQVEHYESKRKRWVLRLC